MADVHTQEIRSKNMAAIKGKNTKHEMLVRQFLHANGFRYKLHDKSLPGKPVLSARPVRRVLPKYKTVIFVHACQPVVRAVFGMGIKPANIMWFRNKNNMIAE